MKNNSENKPVLNKENTKVLNCIVKNAGLTATKIRKKLRWGFVPTRALGFLRNHKFVLVSEAKGYTVSAAGQKALVGSVKPKRAKAVKDVPAVTVETAPVVAVETPEPVMA